MYLFPKWVCERIDKIRRIFLWNGDKESKEGSSCLVAWGEVCTPKDQGALVY